MNDKIYFPTLQAGFQLLGEQALSPDLGQRLVQNLVAGCSPGNNLAFDIWKLIFQQINDMASLDEGELEGQEKFAVIQ